jgi:hypothetical protein
LPVFTYRGQVGAAMDLRLYPSILFGRDYLVAYMEPEWFRWVAPKCDAIAAPSLASQGGAQPPPLVFVPARRARSKSESFRSILEHEFVHVNQGILRSLPDMDIGRGAGTLIASLLARTRAEYEAHLLQLVRWPRLYPRRYQARFSLEHWCLLRGYTQALEETLLAAANDEGFPPEEVVRFLDELPAALPASFRRLGVAKELAAWFQTRHVDYTFAAFGHLFEAVPELKTREPFRAAGRWVKQRLQQEGRWPVRG